MPLALQGQEQSACERGQQETQHEVFRLRRGERRLGCACGQDKESERDVGDLRQQFRGDIDDHRAEGQRRRNAVHDRSARAEHDAAQLRKRQHFCGRVANHACPDEHPQSAMDDSGGSTVQAAPSRGNSPRAHRMRIAKPLHPMATAAENTAPKPTYATK